MACHSLAAPSPHSTVGQPAAHIISVVMQVVPAHSQRFVASKTRPASTDWVKSIDVCLNVTPAILTVARYVLPDFVWNSPLSQAPAVFDCTVGGSGGAGEAGWKYEKVIVAPGNAPPVLLLTTPRITKSERSLSDPARSFP